MSEGWVGRLSIWLSLAIVLAGGASATGAGAHARPQVAYATTVSGAVPGLPQVCKQYQAELGPQIVRHPGSPGLLSVVYQEDGEDAIVGAASSDAGRTWSRGPVSSASTCAGGPSERDGVVNPLLAGGPGSSTYFGNSWLSDDGSFGVSLHRSDNGGIVWAEGGDPAAGAAQNFALAADRRNPEIVHAAWTHDVNGPGGIPLSSAVEAASSTDGGRSFELPVTVYTPPPGHLAVNTRLYRNSDGSLLAIFDTVPTSDLVELSTTKPDGPFVFSAFASRSTDGGETWSPAVPAGSPVFFAFRDADGAGRAYRSAKFDAATGPHGRAIVAWAEPTNNDGYATIRTVRSRDGGLTWSEPSVAVRVRGHMIQPAVEFARDGTVGLFWYDTRNDVSGDGKLTADAWFATSRRGQPWRTVHLAGPMDLSASYDPNVPFYDGHQGLGVYQDATPMYRGFGVTYTVGVPLAGTGVTDVHFSRVRSP